MFSVGISDATLQQLSDTPQGSGWAQRCRTEIIWRSTHQKWQPTALPLPPAIEPYTCISLRKATCCAAFCPRGLGVQAACCRAPYQSVGCTSPNKYLSACPRAGSVSVLVFAPDIATCPVSLACSVKRCCLYCCFLHGNCCAVLQTLRAQGPFWAASHIGVNVATFLKLKCQ